MTFQFKNAYDIAEEIGETKNQRDACQCLYKNYRIKDSYQKSIQYMEQMQRLDSQLDIKNTSKTLQHMEFQKAILLKT